MASVALTPNTNYPSAVDTSEVFNATDNRATINFSNWLTRFWNAIIALQTKVGVDGSLVITTHDYKLGEVTSTDRAVSKAGTQTLTNKTINLTNNTVTTTLAQLNTAVSDADVVSIAGTETLTNKTITKPIINVTNPTAQTYTPSAAGTATLDLSLANQHYITMPAGNIAVALSSDTSNQIFYVSITQDGVGSRAVTWFTTIKWAGGTAPTLTTGASKRDTFIFVRTGSGTYDGFIVGQNV